MPVLSAAPVARPGPPWVLRWDTQPYVLPWVIAVGWAGFWILVFLLPVLRDTDLWVTTATLAGTSLLIGRLTGTWWAMLLPFLVIPVLTLPEAYTPGRARLQRRLIRCCWLCANRYASHRARRCPVSSLMLRCSQELLPGRCEISPIVYWSLSTALAREPQRSRRFSRGAVAAGVGPSRTPAALNDQFRLRFR